MSTIDSASPYDLLATYSTAAAISSDTGLESTAETENNDDFIQMIEDLLGDGEAATGTDTTTDTTLGDVLDEMDKVLDEIESSSSSSTNSLYFRPDGSDPLDVDDSPSDELGFMDMLQLMILQFQNQSMDDTASTTDMMNQLCQMTTMQAMTSMEDSITAMTKTNEMLYISSLVGEEVTVGYTGSDGSWNEEIGIVTGSGYYGGYPVIFLDGKDTFFYTSEILAVGRLPETSTEDDDTTPEVDPDDDGSVGGTGEAGADGSGTTNEDDDTTTGTTAPGDGTEVANINLYGYNYVDYSNMTAEELQEASLTAVG